MRPDLARRGITLHIIDSVKDFAGNKFVANRFRVTVAQFNQQALRISEKAGFRQIESFQRQQDGRYFVVLMWPDQ